MQNVAAEPRGVGEEAHADDEAGEHREAEDAGDGLVAGERAGEHADGDEEETGDGDEEVAADERAGIEEAGIAGEFSQDVEKAAGGGPERNVEEVGRGVFREDDFGGRDGGGQERLDGAEAAFFGEALHGEQRHDEEDGKPEDGKENLGGGGVLRGLAVALQDAGEHEAHHAEEERGRDVGARVDEQHADFVGEEGEVVFHGWTDGCGGRMTND
jgi:hypothetical protein